MMDAELSLDELTEANSKIRADLENQFINSGYESKVVFLAFANVAENLFYLDLTIKAAKELYYVELLPFVSGLTVEAVEN